MPLPKLPVFLILAASVSSVAAVCECSGVTDLEGGGECQASPRGGKEWCYVQAGECEGERVRKEDFAGKDEWEGSLWTVSEEACGGQRSSCPRELPKHRDPCSQEMDCSYGRAGLCMNQGGEWKARCGRNEKRKAAGKKAPARWVVVRSQGCGEGGVCCLTNWFESILSCCFSLLQSGWQSRLGGGCPHTPDSITDSSGHFHPDYYSALATLNMSVLCEETLIDSSVIQARVRHSLGVPLGHTVGVPVGPSVGVPLGHIVGVPLGHTVRVPQRHSVGVPLRHSVGVPLGHSVGVPLSHSNYWGHRLWQPVVHG